MLKRKENTENLILTSIEVKHSCILNKTINEDNLSINLYQRYMIEKHINTFGFNINLFVTLQINLTANKLQLII